MGPTLRENKSGKGRKRKQRKRNNKSLSQSHNSRCVTSVPASSVCPPGHVPSPAGRAGRAPLPLGPLSPLADQADRGLALMPAALSLLDLSRQGPVIRTLHPDSCWPVGLSQARRHVGFNTITSTTSPIITSPPPSQPLKLPSQPSPPPPPQSSHHLHHQSH